MKQFDWNAWVFFVFFFFPFFFWKINTRCVLNIPRHRLRVQAAFALKGLHRHISSLEFVPVPLGLTFQKSLPIKKWVEELYKQKIKHFIKKKIKIIPAFLEGAAVSSKGYRHDKNKGKWIFLQWNYTFLCESLFYLYRTSRDAFSEKKSLIINYFKFKYAMQRICRQTPDGMGSFLSRWGFFLLLQHKLYHGFGIPVLWGKLT